MKSLTLFVSSPGDVRAERQIVGKVIDRLQARYWNFIRLEPVLWEREPLRATGTFQKEIVRPSSCDVVVGILWNRLGTPLPSEFERVGGGRWNSGTEWELNDAVNEFEKQAAVVGEKNARPHVLVYKRTSQRLVEEYEEREIEARQQEEKMKLFEKEFFFNPDGSPKRARSTYETLEEFERVFENHLNDLVRSDLSAFAQQDGEIPIVPISGSPFKGLQAFEVEDAPLFFGRFRAITDVLEQIQSQRDAGNAFVMIYGSSGFGKSSLMRAGVASRLIEPGFIPGTDAWRFSAFFPARGDGTLCENLSRAIFASTCLPELAQIPFNSSQGNSWDIARLSRALESDAKDCFEAISAALDLAGAIDADLPAELDRAPNCHLCLLVDQFEEVFTRNDLVDEERERFFHALGLLSTHPKVWILATMRSEYFPRLADYKALKSLTKKDGGYLLSKPDLTELNQIIRYPALAAGLRFEVDRETNESLSARIYSDMTSDPGALPLLQFCLEELYEQRETEPQPRLTWNAYRMIGGLRGSIATVADTAWAKLSSAAKEARNQVFSELVTVGEKSETLAVRKDADYAAIASAGSGAAEFLESFINAKLLVTSDRKPNNEHAGSIPTVTLAHEALITHWPILTEWIEEHRHLLRARRRFAEYTKQWIEHKKDRQLLLSEGRLRQANEVEDSGFFQLNKNEREVLEKSKKRARGKLAFARGLALVFGLLTLGIGWLYLTAERARESAKQSEIEALGAARRAEESERQAVANARLSEALTEKAEAATKQAEDQKKIAEQREAEAKAKATEALRASARAKQETERAVEAERKAKELLWESEKYKIVLMNEGMKMRQFRRETADALKKMVDRYENSEEPNEKDAAKQSLLFLADRIKDPSLNEKSITPKNKYREEPDLEALEHLRKEFQIPDDLFENDKELVWLIANSESMDDGERQYWFNLWLVMTPSQIEKLRDIFTREREKLGAIEEKYAKEKIPLNQVLGEFEPDEPGTLLAAVSSLTNTITSETEDEEIKDACSSVLSFLRFAVSGHKDGFHEIGYEDLVQRLANLVENCWQVSDSFLINEFPKEFPSLIEMIVASQMTNRDTPPTFRENYLIGYVAYSAKMEDVVLQCMEKVVNNLEPLSSSEEFTSNQLWHLKSSLELIGRVRVNQPGSPELITETYRKIAALQKLEIKRQVDSGQDDRRVADSYGSLSWFQIFSREYKEAVQSAEKSMKLFPQKWVQTNLASALLFSGETEKAMEVHRKNKGKLVDDGTKEKWEHVVKEDFSKFRRVGITHPDMQRVASFLAIDLE